MKVPFFSALALLTLGPTVSAQEKVVVLSTHYPLHYFAERLATGSFELRYPVDPEVDPAFWKPARPEIEAFQKADLILKNGADYEKWMKRVSLRSANQVDTSKSFSDRLIEVKGGEHRHGDGSVHSHAGTAFTTWIDFSQAAEQAGAVAARFQQVRPQEKDRIEANLTALVEELAALDGRMKSFGKRWGDRPLVASHPIYQYLARAYGLKIEALEWEPEMELGASDLGDLKALIGKHPATWMIWEDTPSEANRTALAGLGIKSAVFSPCANRPETGDWLSVMEENLRNLEGMLEPAP